MNATVIDKPDMIELARLLVIEKGLILEIKTPLRHSTNAVFLAAKKLTGKKTRVTALRAIQEKIATIKKAFPPDAPPENTEQLEPCKS